MKKKKIKNKYPFAKSKTEWFFEYLEAKPLTACGMLMIFPGLIPIVPIFLVIKDVGDDVFNWFGGLWFFMAFVLMAFGQKYEKGPDPSKTKDISEQRRISKELEKDNKNN